MTAPSRKPRRAAGWLFQALLGLALALASPACPARAGQAAHADRDGIVSRHVPLGGSGWGLLSMPAAPAGQSRRPAVILLGDGGGPDGRLQLYALRLLSLGVVVLEADDDSGASNDGLLPPPDEIPTLPRLRGALSLLRDAPEVAPGRIGIIGIGAGAHDLLLGIPAWAGSAAAVALVYPACEEALAAMSAAPQTIGAPAATRLLLVHGDADPAGAAACARLAQALGGHAAGVERYVLRGASFGWDLDGASGNGDTLLPDPARTGARWRAMPDPQRALIALDRILLFLLAALDRADDTP